MELRAKLRRLHAWNEARVARLYDAAGLDLALPQEMPYARHVYHLYVIQVPERGLALPMCPHLATSQQGRVVRGVRAVFQAGAVEAPTP